MSDWLAGYAEYSLREAIRFARKQGIGDEEIARIVAEEKSPAEPNQTTEPEQENTHV